MTWDKEGREGVSGTKREGSAMEGEAIWLRSLLSQATNIDETAVVGTWQSSFRVPAAHGHGSTLNWKHVRMFYSLYEAILKWCHPA